MNRNKFKKLFGISATFLGAGFIITSIIAKKKKSESVYKNDPDQKNPFEGKKVIFVEDDTEPENADGVRGHLEATGDSDYKEGVYSKYIKRGLDVVLSFGGLVVLSPILLGISLAIKIDDPGPVLFTQKRLGKNKQYFKLHKFRTMKMNTPHDVPTHQLENPEQYITKVGKFLRTHSLDELPQIWDIFIGNMSTVGPRPGLWNQDLLTAERDKYGANDVKPGLTGWAQINGRDELEIPDKAKLDGEYTEKIGLGMDIKCFLGSLHVFGKDDSVVEGGTGEMHKVGRHYTDGKSDADLIGHIGFGEPVVVDEDTEKHILITGAGSFIGESFRSYAAKHYPSLYINAIDMIDGSWREADFSSYDIIYHVAGIAHADVGNVDEATKAKYYAVNTDLAVGVCEKAKREGVGRFVFMSSAIVYGDSAPYGTQKIIDDTTVPHPANFYGDSKLQADVAVRDMADDKFKVIVLRPPMIYGKGSKGNYPTLAKLAKKMPVFPNVKNERSMLHIDNLCEFLCQLMMVKEIEKDAVVLIPQNPEWTRTSDMVREIGAVSGKKVKLMGLANPAVAVAGKMPGKIGGLVNKAFGNLAYDKEISDYDGMDYQIVDWKESIERTEGLETKTTETRSTGKKALQLASVASMIDQFNIPNIQILQSLGYTVDVVADFTNPGTITKERAEDLKKRLAEMNVRVFDIAIPRSLNPGTISSAYKQVKELLDKENYDILHCHSPIGGAIARKAAKSKRKTGLKVIYTAHGFHFYDGAPLMNWLVFYPVEKYLSRFTDVLITINKEDYNRALKEFYAKKTVYVPGVGVDTEKFAPRKSGRDKIRTELGISDDQIMLLSVGELNENKNHESVVRALAGMKNITYVIVGKGDLSVHLETVAKESNVDLRLMGFRTDVADFYDAADVYVLPSIREGLNVSLMEAMATALPCLCGDIRGNVDLVEQEIGGFLFKPDEVENIRSAIEKVVALSSDERTEQGSYNLKKIRAFDLQTVDNLTSEIYRGV